MNTVYQERMAAAMATALAAKNSAAPDNSAEMRLYLDKLKDLVPHCPKNRNVDKLELIQHVIDYISDLQDTLQSDSDSDSLPESPGEHVNFSDAYNRSSQPLNFSMQQQQQPNNDYSMDYSGASGCSDGASASGFNNGFSSSGCSNMDSSASYESGFVNNPSDYSTILYNDHGTSSAPGYRTSY
ncbi:uncharacterized protein [Procambarus clarkii]|uniref:uncharacterized protein n=1 Tax=Procambarus clarkii TaxID=6728 RepID=UPI001E677994|nr:uncharacterized protein LOC123756123 [Procambarus clarkii]